MKIDSLNVDCVHKSLTLFSSMEHEYEYNQRKVRGKLKARGKIHGTTKIN